MLFKPGYYAAIAVVALQLCAAEYQVDAPPMPNNLDIIPIGRDHKITQNGPYVTRDLGLNVLRVRDFIDKGLSSHTRFTENGCSKDARLKAARRSFSFVAVLSGEEKCAIEGVPKGRAYGVILPKEYLTKPIINYEYFTFDLATDTSIVFQKADKYKTEVEQYLKELKKIVPIDETQSISDDIKIINKAIHQANSNSNIIDKADRQPSKKASTHSKE